MSVKAIFTRSGKELRKEFMGKATCEVRLRGVENLPQGLSSFFVLYSAPDVLGITKIAVPGTVGIGATPEDGTATPGFFVFDENLVFDAPLQVSKQGELLPITLNLVLHGRDCKDQTLTREVGTLDLVLTDQSQLDDPVVTNFFPVGTGRGSQESPPFFEIGTSFHFHSETPAPAPVAAAAAVETETKREWSLGSLISSARSAFTDLNSTVEEGNTKKIVNKGQEVFEKVTADEQTAKLLDKNLAIIEREIDELAKTATGQEVKALVDHYAKKEETQKLLDGAERLLDDVKDRPESKLLVERASKLLEKLEQDEISKRLASEFQETLTSLTDTQRRDLLVQRVGNEEQRAAMASELHATLLNFLKSDQGQAALNEGGDLLLSGQKLLLHEKEDDKVKALVSQLDTLLDDFESDVVGGTYAKQARRLVSGFINDEHGKRAVEKAEALLDKLMSDSTDVRKMICVLVEEGVDTESPEVAEARGMIENIKDAIIEYLSHHLPHIDIPPVKGFSSDTPIGGVHYMVNNLSLSHINLPESDIDANFDPRNGITIDAKNIQVSVKDFTWAYRHSSWVSGVGLGDATVSGASIKINLDFTLEKDRVTFRLGETAIDIADLHIEAVGNKTPWLYNFLLFIFKDTVKRKLESNINEAITENMGSVVEMLNKLSVPMLLERVAAVTDESSSAPAAPAISASE